MFSEDIELKISSDSLRHYREIAYKHLHESSSAVGVALAGLDEGGNRIFGIRLVSNDGEEWYDSKGEEHVIVGWDDEKDAIIELETKVLPQLGYAIHQKDLQQFHKCMN